MIKKSLNNLSLDFINYTEAVEEKFLKTWKIVVVQTLLTIVIASGRTVIVEVCKYRNRTFKLLRCTGVSQLTMKFKFTTPTFFVSHNRKFTTTLVKCNVSQRRLIALMHIKILKYNDVT